MRIVIAPNAFKGSLSALEAATAIGEGIRNAVPDAELVLVPIADGGDGTVDALVAERLRRPVLTLDVTQASIADVFQELKPLPRATPTTGLVRPQPAGRT